MKIAFTSYLDQVVIFHKKKKMNACLEGQKYIEIILTNCMIACMF